MKCYSRAIMEESIVGRGSGSFKSVLLKIPVLLLPLKSVPFNICILIPVDSSASRQFCFRHLCNIAADNGMVSQTEGYMCYLNGPALSDSGALQPRTAPKPAALRGYDKLCRSTSR